MMSCRFLLFDVDNTLVKASKPLVKEIIEALSLGFRVSLNCSPTIPDTAATALAVAEHILLENGISKNEPGYLQKIKQSQEAFQEIVSKGINDGSIIFEALPNVKELLEALSKMTDVKLVLLTANPRNIVSMKLKSAEINPEHFMVNSKLFGAFGCEHSVRSKLVKTVQQRCCDYLHVKVIPPERFLIIGDAPSDISCAHDNDVACVAVATGNYKPQQLSEADFVLEDGFKDLKKSLGVLRDCKRSQKTTTTMKIIEYDYLDEPLSTRYHKISKL